MNVIMMLLKWPGRAILVLVEIIREGFMFMPNKSLLSHIKFTIICITMILTSSALLSCSKDKSTEQSWPDPNVELMQISGCVGFDWHKASIGSAFTSDCMDYTYDGNGLLLLRHIKVYFNCCPDEVKADIGIDGFTITIKEWEIIAPWGGCDCVCPFDFDYMLNDLANGEYTIVIYRQNPHVPLWEFRLALSDEADIGSYCREDL
jgi:hypothetical protein